MSAAPETRGDETYRVALQGFSDFERRTLAAFFRLAAQRRPCYVRIEGVDRADFVIADADHEDALRAVLDADRARDTVFVGALAPHGAMACLPRPLDPMHILRELDALVGQRQTAPGELLAAIEPVLGAGDGLRAVDFEAEGPDVLVVEDSAIARRFLQRRLQELGYRVHLAADGEAAMAQLRAQRFAIVFLDVVLGPAGEVDGLTICQRVKQRPEYASEGGPPAVVMVTGLAGPMDKVRGTLAGCDAYVPKPLTDEALLPVLHQVDPGLAQRQRDARRAAG